MDFSGLSWVSKCYELVSVSRAVKFDRWICLISVCTLPFLEEQLCAYVAEPVESNVASSEYYIEQNIASIFGEY